MPDNIKDLIDRNRFLELPITTDHTKIVGSLPFIHKDPFDRILIAQSLHENLSLITRDKVIAKYESLKVTRA